MLLKTASLISQVSSSAKLITGGGNGLSVCEEGAQEGAREARLNSSTEPVTCKSPLTLNRPYLSAEELFDKISSWLQ